MRRSAPQTLAILLTILIGFTVPCLADFIGDAGPTSFSVCEEARTETGAVRPECRASDVRFDNGTDDASDFGFSVATGLLNGDDLADLVVGDPALNRVYVFFGRPSATAAYGLDASDLADRRVTPSQADVILQPAAATGSFGFSVAVGEAIDTSGDASLDCGPDDLAAALVIGAPGRPGTTGNAAGTVYYLGPGSLCMAAVDPPATTTLDPAVVGQAFTSPDAAMDDEFGYVVALARAHEDSAEDDDVIAAARGAGDGAGRVYVMPVIDDAVDTGSTVRVDGAADDGLGEALDVGDLDDDFDIDTNPFGGSDDFAVSGVGGAGRVLLVRGPLSTTGGAQGNGIYTADDDAIRVLDGEIDGDYFGFSLAVAEDGSVAVGAIYAHNLVPDPEGPGNPATNVGTRERINAGKVYLFAPGLPDLPNVPIPAADALAVIVARRSGDQLGFAMAFGDLNGTGDQNLVMTARREDGSGVTVDEIDQGTAYIVLGAPFDDSPVDLGNCGSVSDCTGVAGIDVLLFGGDRTRDRGDEMGFAAATGNWNGDTSDDLALSSISQNRVYLVTLEDTDGDRDDFGRNIRDNDDDDDGDTDDTDCAPLDADTGSATDEIVCNGVDENCNGLDDDVPDEDMDTFDACGDGTIDADCDDGDPDSFPGAVEVCDGNDNVCDGSVPSDESDRDDDGYVACASWDDTQGDNDTILGGDDCNDFDGGVFPGAAPNETVPDACMRDEDDDDWGDLAPGAGETPGTDCDDASAATFPGSAPNDSPVACLADLDDDDFGDEAAVPPVAAGTDCADSDPVSFLGAPELCDGNDNACNGTIPPAETDPDNDLYVACSGWSDPQNDQPLILGGGDCDQTDATTFPGASPNEIIPTACTKDSDGDDWGDSTVPPGVRAGSDCDDDSIDTFPGAAEIEAPLNCMKDADDDGYGDDSAPLPVVAGGDCDDDDPTRFAGAVETADDGIDQDCNGFDTVTCFEDQDSDGFGSTGTVLSDDGDCDDSGESAFDTDCDDDDPALSPGETDVPDDGVDQDCNGFDTVTCVLDADMDGFGTTAGTTALAPDGSCDASDGESTTADDCRDDDPATFPGAPEACDGNDNACDGTVPPDEADGDGDGYVPCLGWDDTQGDDPAILGGDDCDDTAADVFPGAAANESFSGQCMKDADGDDWGDVSPPAGVTAGTDCDDDSADAADTFPGAAQVEAPLNCMRDVDDDGYGDTAVSLPVVAGTDCNDADGLTFPGATELCDGNDNACAGSTPPTESDDDGDGYVECSGWNDVQGDDPAVVAGGDCDDGRMLAFPGSSPNEPFPTACMLDGDDDDYGDQTPPAGITPGTDCDDASPVTFPGAAEVEAPFNCMTDGDDDGWGDDGAMLPVVAGTDCDDVDGSINPGEPEIPGDGIDQDCDGLDSVTCFVDNDLDGFGTTDTVFSTDSDCDDSGESSFDTDCDDSADTVFPGAPETVDDGIDQDCNGADTVTCVVDADMDGFGTDAGTTVLAGDGSCDAADGESTTADDCDDADPAVFTGAAPLDDPGACMRDADGDDFGDETAAAPVAPGTDCNDADAAVNPGEAEIPGDGIDQDCDGTDQVICFVDGDLDGFGGTGTTFPPDGDCDDPGESTVDTDCDDSADTVFPGAPETPDDGIDQDCSGADTVTCVVDADMDGFGTDAGTTVLAADGSCDTAESESATADDCDDASPVTFPGAAGIEAPLACMRDGDDDGWGDDTAAAPVTPGTDCDDADDTIFPGAPEVVGDGIDQDCDGSDGATCFVDGDLDGFGSTDTLVPPDGDCDDPGESTVDTDCDDADDTIFPGAPETPDDGIDQDCNGADTVTCVDDLDMDGFGTDLGTLTLADDGTCDAAQGESTSSDDCDDADPASYPGAPETCDGNDNACAGSVPANEQDGDGDGYVSCAGWSDAQGDDPSILGGDDCDDTHAGSFPGSAPNETFPEACFRDDDGDDWGDLNPPAGVDQGTDCDDTAADTFPGAAAIEAPLNCMKDSDDDDWGDAAVSFPVVMGTDCDDNDDTRFPGAAEICGDGIDQDCDGSDDVCPDDSPAPGIRRVLPGADLEARRATSPGRSRAAVSGTTDDPVRRLRRDALDAETGAAAPGDGARPGDAGTASASRAADPASAPASGRPAGPWLEPRAGARPIATRVGPGVIVLFVDDRRERE